MFLDYTEALSYSVSFAADNKSQPCECTAWTQSTVQEVALTRKKYGLPDNQAGIRTVHAKYDNDGTGVTKYCAVLVYDPTVYYSCNGVPYSTAVLLYCFTALLCRTICCTTAAPWVSRQPGCRTYSSFLPITRNDKNI